MSRKRKYDTTFLNHNKNDGKEAEIESVGQWKQKYVRSDIAGNGICDCVYKATKDLAEQQNLLKHAWINLGVELPFDGSRWRC